MNFFLFTRLFIEDSAGFCVQAFQVFVNDTLLVLFVVMLSSVFSSSSPQSSRWLRWFCFELLLLPSPSFF